MTTNNSFEVRVYSMIEVFNGLRYDEDGELVERASRVVSFDVESLGRFDEIKWAIADQIGYDICSIYDEGAGFIVYEILNADDLLEYIRIELGEGSDVNVTYCSWQEMMK